MRRVKGEEKREILDSRSTYGAEGVVVWFVPKKAYLARAVKRNVRYDEVYTFSNILAAIFNTVTFTPSLTK